MRQERPTIEAAAAGLFRTLGYETKGPRGGYALSSYDLGYRAATGGRDKIKVEINVLERVPVLDLVAMPLRHPFELPRPEVRTYRLPELAAGKVRALLQRRGPKDVFDVATISEATGEGIAPPMRELAVLYCAFDRVDLREADLEVTAAPADIENVMLSYVRNREEFAPHRVLERANRFLAPLKVLGFVVDWS